MLSSLANDLANIAACNDACPALHFPQVERNPLKLAARAGLAGYYRVRGQPTIALRGAAPSIFVVMSRRSNRQRAEKLVCSPGSNQEASDGFGGEEVFRLC